jgi:pimeloyl-ACP methyl ester carboxylesterase
MRLPFVAVLLLSASLISAINCVTHESEPVPFRVSADEQLLKDLKERLNRTVWPHELEDVDDWSYGVPLSFMKDIVRYWQFEYDWRKQEQILNEKLPGFKIDVDGLDIHFAHVKSKERIDAIPLLISHGWPGSYYECSKVVDLLTNPSAHGITGGNSFHVVCPSLPGYGFSDKPRKKGFDALQMAHTFDKLMKKLGYTKYMAHGGDWGSLITRYIGQHHPESCLSVHINNPLDVNPPFSKGLWAKLKAIMSYVKPNWVLDEKDTKRHNDNLGFLSGIGYLYQQSTFPQTLGYGLSDSPAGMAAWIIDKWYHWSDIKGDIFSRYSKDDLLNNVMIYYLNNTITSSTRLYKETIPKQIASAPDNFYVSVPSGITVFQDISKPISAFIPYYYNVVREVEYPSGGHFAILEEPKLVAQSLAEFAAVPVVYQQYYPASNEDVKQEL